MKTVLSLYCLALPPTSLLAPKGVVPLLVVTALAAAVLAWRSGLRLRPPDRRILAAIGVLLAWCFIGQFWGLGLKHALVLTGRMAALLAAGMLLFAIASAVEDDARARLGRWLVLGTGLSLAIMAAEIALDYPLIRLLHPERIGTHEARIGLNRGATAMAILAWPAAAFLWTAGARRAAFALLIVTGLILPFLASLAATLGFAVATVVAAAASLHERVGRIILIAATIVALAGSPIAAKLLYGWDLQSAEWLPGSVQHRIEIWNFTTDLIAEKPLFGWGFDASRHISEVRPQASESGRPTITLHPHSAPLQILLELGLAGAAIALAIAVMLIARLEAVPRPVRPLAQGMYAASLTIACVAYGLWQNQWLALLASAAVVVRLTAPRRLQGDRETRPTDPSAESST